MPRLDYFAPGVYIEEIDRGSRPIEGVSTNVAGFIGFTEDIRNGAELGMPMLVTSWTQYREYFASVKENGSLSDGFTDFNAYLPFAVYGFFLNGGGRCWVVSIGTYVPDVRNNSRQIPRRQDLVLQNRGRNRELLTFQMRPEPNVLSKGELLIEIKDSKSLDLPQSLPPQDPPLDKNELFSISIRQGRDVLIEYPYLTMRRDVSEELRQLGVQYVVEALESSTWLQVQPSSITAQATFTPAALRPINGRYRLSSNPLYSQQNNWRQDIEGSQDQGTGIQGLFEIDDVNIVACPDLMRVYQAGLIDLDQLHGLMGLMVDMCEASINGGSPNPPNRMVVLDTPPFLGSPPSADAPASSLKPQEVAQWLSEFNRRSMFAALYYPWVKVANPRDGGRPMLVPPSGYMAGVWSRVDETRGVYKAPANEVPRGIMGLAYETNFREQELLNPIGINCIRTFPNRGIRIWGARTLVEPDKTEWRYISVRRLISYIEKSIELGTQWVVFEPNDEDLWARVTRVVTNFLTRLWREGALFGATPQEAFYVKCDSELNTPDTMLLGRLYVEIGVSPVRPAEFVIFRISQWNSSDGA